MYKIINTWSRLAWACWKLWTPSSMSGQVGNLAGHPGFAPFASGDWRWVKKYDVPKTFDHLWVLGCQVASNQFDDEIGVWALGGTTPRKTVNSTEAFQMGFLLCDQYQNLPMWNDLFLLQFVEVALCLHVVLLSLLVHQPLVHFLHCRWDGGAVQAQKQKRRLLDHQCNPWLGERDRGRAWEMEWNEMVKTTSLL